MSDRENMKCKCPKLRACSNALGTEGQWHWNRINKKRVTGDQVRVKRGPYHVGTWEKPWMYS